MPGFTFLLDEDSSDRDLIRALRTRNIAAVTASEANLLGRSDRDQLEYARANGHIVYTANMADFARLHAAAMRAGEWHPGIIVRTWQLMPVGQQLRAVLAIDELETPTSLQNRLLYLEEYRLV